MEGPDFKEGQRIGQHSRKRNAVEELHEIIGSEQVSFGNMSNAASSHDVGHGDAKITRTGTAHTKNSTRVLIPGDQM